MASGWNKGVSPSAETRAKMSAAHTGKKRGPHTPEHNAKISAAHTGKPLSPEHCVANSVGHIRHGHSTKTRSRTYVSWRLMIQRCTNETAPNYYRYGGRGIKVDPSWHIPQGTGHVNVGFENFLACMGPRPSGMTLDRIDPNGNYEPGNVRWATPKEQTRNRRPKKLAA